LKTRNLLIAALVVVLLVVYYLLGTGYLKGQRDSQAMTSQIADTSWLLAQVPPLPTDQEARLATAEADLEAAKQAFPAYLNSTRTINTILKIAEETGVKAIPLITQPWKIQDINGFSYSVFRLNVTASGNFTRVSSFLERLETGELETLVIENLTVDTASGVPLEEASEGMAWVTATIQIAVYSRPPTTD
jgi:hypothetical protein